MRGDDTPRRRVFRSTVAALAVLAVIVGTLGPWVTFPWLGEAGGRFGDAATGSDDTAILVGGVVAGLAAALNRRAPGLLLPVAVFALSALVVEVLWVERYEFGAGLARSVPEPQRPEAAQPGWGLLVATAGAAVLVAVGGLAAWGGTTRVRVAVTVAVAVLAAVGVQALNDRLGTEQIVLR